jgi:thiamine kinase-like enzyme
MAETERRNSNCDDAASAVHSTDPPASMTDDCSADNHGFTDAGRVAYCVEHVPGWRAHLASDAGAVICVAPLTGGMSNVLFTATLTPSPAFGDDNTNNIKLATKAVVREYGSADSLFFERATEIVMTRALSAAGVGPIVYGEFDGGRVEQFYGGVTTHRNDLWVPAVSRAMAKALARVHAFDPQSTTDTAAATDSQTKATATPAFDTRLVKWMSHVEGIMCGGGGGGGKDEDDGEAGAAFAAAHPTLTFTLGDLRRAHAHVESIVGGDAFTGDVVFCHNDFFEGNMIVERLVKQNDASNNNNNDGEALSPGDGSADAAAEVDAEAERIAQDACMRDLKDESDFRFHVIDFEYGAVNYRAFDLANMFCEHYIEYGTVAPPYYTVSEANAPSTAYKRRFIQNYLRASKSKESGDVDDEKAVVDKLLRDVAVMQAASAFLWVLWSVIQVDKSEIDFAYDLYAVARWNDYQRLLAQLETQH